MRGVSSLNLSFFFYFLWGSNMPVEELNELEVKLPTVGERFKAKLVKIRKGLVRELIDIENIRNEELKRRYERYADREAVELTLDVVGQQVRRILPISYRSNSRFYKLMKKYGKLAVGMEIDVTIDDRGRVRIVYE